MTKMLNRRIASTIRVITTYVRSFSAAKRSTDARTLSTGRREKDDQSELDHIDRVSCRHAGEEDPDVEGSLPKVRRGQRLHGGRECRRVLHKNEGQPQDHERRADDDPKLEKVADDDIHVELRAVGLRLQSKPSRIISIPITMRVITKSHLTDPGFIRTSTFVPT